MSKFICVVFVLLCAGFSHAECLDASVGYPHGVITKKYNDYFKVHIFQRCDLSRQEVPFPQWITTNVTEWNEGCLYADVSYAHSMTIVQEETLMVCSYNKELSRFEWAPVR